MRLASRPSPAGRLTLTLRTKIASTRWRWRKLRQAPGPPPCGWGFNSQIRGRERSQQNLIFLRTRYYTSNTAAAVALNEWPV
jgi:hypothetical protein